MLQEIISDALLPVSTISLEEVYLLEKDTQLLYSDIRSAVALGIAWDAEHYGFPKEQFDIWRLNILTLKQTLTKKLKNDEQAAKDMLDLHKKTIMPRTFPKISPTTWH